MPPDRRPKTIPRSRAQLRFFDASVDGAAKVAPPRWCRVILDRAHARGDCTPRAGGWLIEGFHRKLRSPATLRLSWLTRTALWRSDMRHPEIEQRVAVVPVQSSLAWSASWLPARLKPDFEASASMGAAQGRVFDLDST